MGGLLALLKGKEADEVFIDFDNAEPSASEQETYNKVAEVLARGAALIELLQDYKGCQDLAQKAMRTPTKENEEEAFVGLLGAVNSIAAFFHYAKDLETVVPELLDAISTAPAADSKDAMANQQALCKQLADVFDFALRFDGARMQKPNLSNDFSYYRRLLSKFGKHKDIKVKDEEASGMALFTAEHIPMMACLSKGGNRAREQNANVTPTLAIMANSCMKMLRAKRFTKESTILLCARAMTGSIVLYDLIDQLGGAFTKKSPIQVKACIQTLQKEFPKEVAEPLTNAIRFSSKTFKDAPQSLQDLLQ